MQLESTKKSIDISPEIFSALKNSLYPGASDSSILMVLEYCKAAKLDPIQKPVHIVSMLVKTGKKDAKGYDIKEYRDVIMPGIGLYRTQAHRSGMCLGTTSPEFGEDITERIGDLHITYPKYCKITVKKLVGTHIVEFTAIEFWKENYASKSNSDKTPNIMWAKRPYAQIAKCAEAQALRKAFPELLGSQPTAEEMEGKLLDYEDISESNTTEKTKELDKILDERVSTTSSDPSGAVALTDKKNEPLGFNSIINSLSCAKTIPELSEVMNLTNKLTDPEQKRIALKKFKECRAELEKPQTTPKEMEDFIK